MLGSDVRATLCDEIVRASCEAIGVVDLGRNVLPLLDRLFDASTSLAYHCDDDGQIIPIAGQMLESIPLYVERYLAIDPLQEVLRTTNPLLLHSAQMPNWGDYLASAAYNECASPNGIDNFLHLRLCDGEMYAPGMVGIMIARTFAQPDFCERDKLLLGTVLPALEALARRHRRLDEAQRNALLVESLLEHGHAPTIVFDLRGRCIWASERAGALLGAVPEALALAARRLACQLYEGAAGTLTLAVALARGREPNLMAELRIVRSRHGTRLIVAELDDPDGPPSLFEVAAKCRLSKTETRVLQLLAEGLSNKEIASRLFVSVPTVHSHVNHVLAKLGVDSRTRAALLAHGVRLPL